VLGRQVELRVLDDASSPTLVAANYEQLIGRDRVDLLFGPFSTLLSVPAAHVADRHGYAFPEPAGGGLSVFAQKLGNLFFVQAAPTTNCGDSFVKYVLSLPAARRPKTAAYPTLDDPFAAPIVQRSRAQLEAAGVRTVFKTTYPATLNDLTRVVGSYAKRKPDLVFAGTQTQDAYAQVNAMVRLKFSPKFLFMSNGASAPTDFPANVGANHTSGIFTCGDWFSHSKTAGNPEFVQAYVARYGGTPQAIDPTSAEAYSVGQLIELVAKRTGAVDNRTIIISLHGGNWPVVEGTLSWNSAGEPKGSLVLAEWISGKLLPVYPADQAVATPFSPKPKW
jgi:branched-chain amino acid transport system substrate-binding protein